MSLVIGLFAVSISILGWGSYFVPMKRIKQYDPFYFQLLMCMTILISSILVSLFFNSFIFSYWGFLSGVLWASGNILSAQAVKYSGLSKAAPLWMGAGILTSFAWGLIFFNEPVNSIVLGLLAIIFLISGIFFISSTSDSGNISNPKGLIFTIAAGVIFGSYLVPLKLSGLDPIPFLFPMSLGIFTGGVFIYLIKRPSLNRGILIPGAASGLIWNVANVASFFAVKSLGIAIGFPLAQIALFVSVLWGLLYFKEIKSKKSIQKLVLGAIILFIGAILLTLSK